MKANDYLFLLCLLSPGCHVGARAIPHGLAARHEEHGSTTEVRISNQEADIEGKQYKFEGDPHDRGDGMYSYILDCGIDLDDPDIKDAYDAGDNHYSTNKLWPLKDPKTPFLHANAVASVIAGKKHGILPKAKVFFVQICLSDKDAVVDVKEGIEWATRHIKRHGREKKANMVIPLAFWAGKLNQAYGPEYVGLLMEAIEKALEAGIPVIGAAGTQGKPITNVVPARSKDMITVGTTTGVSLTEQEKSNYGTLVDILGPGSGVLAGQNDLPFRGGSAATAVAGALELYMQWLEKADSGADRRKRFLVLGYNENVVLATRSDKKKNQTPKRFLYNGGEKMPREAWEEDLKTGWGGDMSRKKTRGFELLPTFLLGLDGRACDTK